MKIRRAKTEAPTVAGDYYKRPKENPEYPILPVRVCSYRDDDSRIAV